MPFTDSYDIATEHFKSMVDSYVSSLTITQEEIDETERETEGKNKNNLWFEKRKSDIFLESMIKTKIVDVRFPQPHVYVCSPFHKAHLSLESLK